jgi:alkaline phosphatase D
MLNRRTFLLAASGVILPALTPRLLAQPRFQTNPFTLGVASGYPSRRHRAMDASCARSAQRRRHAGFRGGVTWEIADNESFRNVLRKGVERTTPELAHSIHTEISGLEAARWYWYRFNAGDAMSPVGRFRTAPAADATNNRLRFALASCQQYRARLLQRLPPYGARRSGYGDSCRRLHL